jgi:hypothetical protein
MAVTWTEAFASFVPANTNWQNYDIFTTNSVPKGAVAHIVAASVNDAAARTVGIRADGSALSRYVKLHEGEAGGAVCASFYVLVDATTGLIETYADDVTGITFYLMGYWEGVTYTELFADISATSSAAWDDRDVYTNQGVPKGRVCECMCNNLTDGASRTMGVRTSGSALSRYIVLHEAESASVETTDATSWSMCVLSGMDGIIEVYASTNTTQTCYLMGYFGPELTYQENFQTGSTASTGFVDWDVTAYLDIDGQVAEIACGNAATGVEYNFGCRANGSALNRYILVHESETNGVNGFTTACGTDAAGILEMYVGNASSEYFRFLGYFRNRVNNEVTDTLLLTDAIAASKGRVITDTLTLTDAITKVGATAQTITDAIALTDAITRPYRGLSATDTMTSTDAVLKRLGDSHLADALTLTDATVKRKSFSLTDSLSLADSVLRGKTIILTETLVLTDVITRVYRGLSITDTLTLTDSILKRYGASYLPDGLTLTDTMVRGKKFALADTLALTDAITKNKSFTLTDTLLLTDAIATPVRITLITDDIVLIETVTQAALRIIKVIDDLLTLDDAFLGGKYVVVTVTDTLDVWRIYLPRGG